MTEVKKTVLLPFAPGGRAVGGGGFAIDAFLRLQGGPIATCNCAALFKTCRCFFFFLVAVVFFVFLVAVVFFVFLVAVVFLVFLVCFFFFFGCRCFLFFWLPLFFFFFWLLFDLLISKNKNFLKSAAKTGGRKSLRSEGFCRSGPMAYLL